MNLTRSKWESISLDAVLEHNKKVLTSKEKHTYYIFCKCADNILKSEKNYLSDNLLANTIMIIDKTLLETYDSSVPRYNIRIQPIYTAWKWYMFLFQDIQTTMKPDHQFFQCNKSPFNKSSLLVGLAYDCKLLHSKSNQPLEQIFKTIGSRETANDEYSDDWFLHTPSKSQYTSYSVLHLSVAILELRKIEKKSEEKKKEQDRIAQIAKDKKERRCKLKLIKKDAEDAKKLQDAQNEANAEDEKERLDKAKLI